jgi:indole-3-acetate monooxygenase
LERSVHRFPLDLKERRAALLAQVDRVIPIIAEDASEGEELRHVPRRTSAAIRDAGLVLLRTPYEAGGAEADTPTQMEVIERLAYHNSAAAWCLLNNSNLLGMISANVSDEALAEIYGGPSLPVPAGGGGMIPGELVAVDGGFRLTGRWSWGSGMDGADWIVVPGALVVGDDMPPQVYSCIFPKAQATLFDNWHAVGLKGTGSCDFAAENLFIPAAFTYPHRTSSNVSGPRRGGPLYRQGIYSYTSPAYVALLGGIARRAMDEIMAIARSKKRTSAGTNRAVFLADRHIFQRFIAEADLTMRGLRSLAAALAVKSYDAVMVTQASDPAVDAEIRAVGSLMAKTAAEVARNAFYYAGGSGIWSGHILERCLRDLQVASTHIWVSDVALEDHGRNLIECVPG